MASPQKECYKILYNVGRQIKLLEIIAAAMKRLIDEVDFNWEERQPENVWLEAEAAISDLLSVTESGSSLLPKGYEDAWKGEKPDSFLDAGSTHSGKQSFRG
jgi:hypothetical protein